MNEETIDVPEDYESIQKAIEESKEGTEISVSSGTYEEEINVDVDNLKLKGPNSGVPAYTKNRKDEAVIDGPIKVMADNSGVVLDGFKILDKTVLLGDSIYFINNIVESDSDGLAVGSASQPQKSGFKIAQNEIITEDSGIFVSLNEETESVEIVRNVIENGEKGINTIGAYYKNIEVEITNNVFVRNEKGIMISAIKGDVRIEHNTILKTSKNGIELYADPSLMKSLKIRYNQIEDVNDRIVLVGKKHDRNVEIRDNRPLTSLEVVPDKIAEKL